MTTQTQPLSLSPRKRGTQTQPESTLDPALEPVLEPAPAKAGEKAGTQAGAPSPISAPQPSAVPEARLERMALVAGQSSLLRLIARDHATTTDLAKQTGRDRANMAKSLDRLQAAGLIVQAAQSRHWHLTETGRSDLDALNRALDPDPEQADTLPGWKLIPHDQLIPGSEVGNNPRTDFDPQAIDALAESIADMGLLQNLVCYQGPDGRYVLISGERRWRAIGQLIAEETWPIERGIPCQVMTAPLGTEQDPHYAPDYFAAAVVENMVREDLNLIDQAKALARLTAMGKSPSQIAGLIGRTPRFVQLRLQLLQCDQGVQNDLALGLMTVNEALETLRAPKRPAPEPEPVQPASLALIGTLTGVSTLTPSPEPESAPDRLDDALWGNTRLSRLCPDITPEVYAASATARALSDLVDALLLIGAEPQVRAPTVSDWPSLHIPSRDTEIYVFASIDGWPLIDPDIATTRIELCGAPAIQFLTELVQGKR
jgi:DNA-binding MarR family transcriptional regulator